MTVADLFARAFGHPPDGLWAAPGRVNLIGEHTDYNDGFALPVALPLRTVAAAAVRSDAEVLLRSVQVPDQPAATTTARRDPAELPQWARYAAGVVWAMADAGHRVAGLEVLVDGDVPLGSGLSSSAALGCSVALALNDLLALGLSRPELARMVQRADHDYAGVPSGLLDQMASLCCRPAQALFLDFRSGAAEAVPLDLGAAGLSLLVINTGVQRTLVAGEYAERRTSCRAAAAAMGVASLRDATIDQLELVADPRLRRRARHVITENDRTLAVVGLLGRGRPADIGPVLSDSHASLRDDYQVSCPELDVAVDAAVGAGALGARLTGAGFGGCAIALTPDGAAGAVAGAVGSAFESRGWAAPVMFPMAPSEGATRLS